MTQSAVIALDIGSVAARLHRNLAALVLPRTRRIDEVSVVVSRIDAVAVEVGFRTAGQHLGAASRCTEYPGLAAATEALKSALAHASGNHDSDFAFAWHGSVVDSGSGAVVYHTES